MRALSKALVCYCACHPERSEGSHNRSLDHTRSLAWLTSLWEIPYTFVRDDNAMKSGAWVRLGVGFLQALDCDVRVYLGR